MEDIRVWALGPWHGPGPFRGPVMRALPNIILITLVLGIADGQPNVILMPLVLGVARGQPNAILMTLVLGVATDQPHLTPMTLVFGVATDQPECVYGGSVGIG